MTIEPQFVSIAKRAIIRGSDLAEGKGVGVGRETLRQMSGQRTEQPANQVPLNLLAQLPLDLQLDYYSRVRGITDPQSKIIGLYTQVTPKILVPLDLAARRLDANVRAVSIDVELNESRSFRMFAAWDDEKMDSKSLMKHIEAQLEANGKFVADRELRNRLGSVTRIIGLSYSLDYAMKNQVALREIAAGIEIRDEAVFDPNPFLVNRAEIYSLQLSATKEVFVAMWFGSEMQDAYELGIKSAIETAGLKPTRIDEQQFNGRIDDEILMSLRRSYGVVADLTHGDQGHRGSVYFELGYAMALAPLRDRIILTCQEHCINDLAFDIRQYNSVVWRDIEDLHVQLRERIAATLVDP